MDNNVILEMLKDVKQYELTIRKQFIALEQARLKKLEVERLDNEIKSLKDR